MNNLALYIFTSNFHEYIEKQFRQLQTKMSISEKRITNNQIYKQKILDDFKSYISLVNFKLCLNLQKKITEQLPLS